MFLIFVVSGKTVGILTFIWGSTFSFCFGIIVDPEASQMHELIAEMLLQLFLAIFLAFILPMPVLSLQHIAQRYHLPLLVFVHCPALLFRLPRLLLALFLDLRQVQQKQLLDRSVVLDLALHLLFVKCGLALVDRISLFN